MCNQVAGITQKDLVMDHKTYSYNRETLKLGGTSSSLFATSFALCLPITLRLPNGS